MKRAAGRWSTPMYSDLLKQLFICSLQLLYDLLLWPLLSRELVASWWRSSSFLFFSPSLECRHLKLKAPPSPPFWSSSFSVVTSMATSPRVSTRLSTGTVSRPTSSSLPSSIPVLSLLLRGLFSGDLPLLVQLEHSSLLCWLFWLRSLLYLFLYPRIFLLLFWSSSPFGSLSTFLWPSLVPTRATRRIQLKLLWRPRAFLVRFLLNHGKSTSCRTSCCRYLRCGILYPICGVIPFGIVFVELYFFLSSIWMGSYYYMFGFLFIIFCLLVLTTAELSIIITYSLLCSENYHWWWNSILASGFSAIYVFVFSVYYFFTTFTMTSLIAIVKCLGYFFYSSKSFYRFITLFSISFFLVTGFVGFIASFIFVMAIFGAVKVD